MKGCCNQIREGSGGITYSYAILGVLCPSCEFDAQREYEESVEAERRAALTDAERNKEDIDYRWREGYWRLQAIAGKFGNRTPNMPLKPGSWRYANIPF